jgi:NO-binding membrane sensor protein with MHYT domain
VIISVVFTIFASALALFVASRPLLPVGVLALASVCMGIAISGMHYIGMWAMRLPGVITWRPVLVALSIATAIAASFAALLLAFRLRRAGGVYWGEVGCRLVDGNRHLGHALHWYGRCTVHTLRRNH